MSKNWFVEKKEIWKFLKKTIILFHRYWFHAKQTRFVGSHWNYTEFPEFSTKINNSCLKKTVHAKSIEKAKKRNMIKEVMKCYAAFGK